MTVLDIYARVSRKGDERQLSPRGQVKHCRAVVSERGATLGAVLVDDGKSAWNQKVTRPDWDMLMSRLESGDTDGVIVYDLSRFTRHPPDGERLIELAQRGLLVLDSEREWNLTLPDDKASFRDQMKMAAYYSDRTSRNTKRGKKLRAQDGLSHGGPRPFGFEPDGVSVRPDEAKIIRDWAARLLSGESQGALVAEAAAAGLRTAAGLPWKRTTVSKMILRPRNVGLVEHNGEIVGEMAGEPILDRAVWDRLVAMFAARRRGRPVKHLCSGKQFSACDVCGHWLTGRPRPHHAAYPDGSPKREYWCSPATGGCGHVHIDGRGLDDWAADWAIRTLSDPQHADAVAERERSAHARRSELEAEARGIEATLEDLNTKLSADLPAAIRAGRRETVLRRHDEVTAPLTARLDEIAEAVRELDSELPAAAPVGRLRRLQDVDPGGVAWMHWLDVFTNGSTGEQREALRHALDGRLIVVSRGRDLAARVSVRDS